MGLLERLQQAKQERDGAERSRDASVDIDLTAAETVNKFGYPTPCPECGGPGYLDHIDLVNRIQEQHCPQCRAEWSLAEDELIIEV